MVIQTLPMITRLSLPHSKDASSFPKGIQKTALPEPKGHADWLVKRSNLAFVDVRSYKDAISLRTPKPKKEFPTNQNVISLATYLFGSSW